jgi:hypothetical protein
MQIQLSNETGRERSRAFERTTICRSNFHSVSMVIPDQLSESSLSSQKVNLFDLKRPQALKKYCPFLSHLILKRTTVHAFDLPSPHGYIEAFIHHETHCSTHWTNPERMHQDNDSRSTNGG